MKRDVLAGLLAATLAIGALTYTAVASHWGPADGWLVAGPVVLGLLWVLGLAWALEYYTRSPVPPCMDAYAELVASRQPVPRYAAQLCGDKCGNATVCPQLAAIMGERTHHAQHAR